VVAYMGSGTTKKKATQYKEGGSECALLNMSRSENEGNDTNYTSSLYKGTSTVSNNTD
jgi:hypothetical protein